MLRKLIVWIAFLVICSTFVTAFDLNLNFPRSHQRVNYVQEEIMINKLSQQVEFKAAILVDDLVYNVSDWVTFDFFPIFSSEDIVENYQDFVAMQTDEWGGGSVFEFNKNGTYTREYKNDSSYAYNVSLKELKRWNSIIFKANFTLKNRVIKTGDYRYRFFNVERTNVNNPPLVSYWIPNDFEIKDITVPGSTQYGSKYLIFTPSEGYVDKPVYFLIEDLKEKKDAEFKEKIIDVLINLVFLIGGVLLTVAYDAWKNRKNKTYVRSNMTYLEGTKIRKTTKERAINWGLNCLRFIAPPLAVLWTGGILLEWVINTQKNDVSFFLRYGEITLTLFGFTLITAIFEKKEKPDIVRHLFYLSIAFLCSTISFFLLYSISILFKDPQWRISSLLYPILLCIGCLGFVYGLITLLITLINYAKKI
jgi:hypothetical protein